MFCKDEINFYNEKVKYVCTFEFLLVTHWHVNCSYFIYRCINWKDLSNILQWDAFPLNFGLVNL